uniref:Uncharacterized protein n=1 Tax=Arundo donax TaxID=35708 RepID=A0A0A9G2C5_ARUDO
MTINGGFW